jgi:hypothetical protein
MYANLITLIRLFLVFVAVALFNLNFYANVAMFALTIIIIAMDWADGYVARKRNESSDFGALFDIAGDRIVENVLWIYFAIIQMVPFWVPKGICDGLTKKHCLCHKRKDAIWSKNNDGFRLGKGFGEFPRQSGRICHIQSSSLLLSCRYTDFEKCYYPVFVANWRKYIEYFGYCW